MESTQLAAQQIAERQTTVGGVASRVLEVEGEGPPLLFVHGYADSADTWRPMLERCAQAGRAALAIDLKGFGIAEGLGGGLMLPQWDEMVDAAVLRHATDEGLVIVGNSLGGALAMRAAERQELPIAGIVPIAPAGLEMARWFAAIENEWLIRLLSGSPVPVPSRVVKPIVGRVYRTLAFSEPAIAEANAVATFTSHLSSLERSMGVLDIGRRLIPELTDPFDLEAIDCPLLLVWGDRDRMVYMTGAERVLRTVDYADIEVLAGCGHCPQLERPDELAELVLEFPRD